jgi:hypothetical protein
MVEILLRFFENRLEHSFLHKVEEWLTAWLEHHPRLKVPFVVVASAMIIVAVVGGVKDWWRKRRAGSAGG